MKTGRKERGKRESVDAVSVLYMYIGPKKYCDVGGDCAHIKLLLCHHSMLGHRSYEE